MAQRYGFPVPDANLDIAWLKNQPVVKTKFPKITRVSKNRLNQRDIAFVQKELTEMNYNPGPVDGLMGKKTALAIKAFEKDQNLPITGKITKALINLLKNL